MATVKIAKEAFDVALVPGGCLVIGLLKLGVTNKCLAVLTPVLRLWIVSVSERSVRVPVSPHR